ncbi:MAG: leucine-rich repeat protein [Candidatus Methanomethylophilaceae archaeon]|nr:leucine-rich repeat protein [Candidatus Methanomethylophilaceae archaeon]
MTLIALRCPNCSGDIALDDSREYGFCLYCGTKIMVQKYVKAESSVSAQLSNLKPIVEKSFQDGKLEKSLEYSDRLISENAADADVWYMRGICLALRDGFRIDGDRDSKESYSLKPTKEAMSCFYNYAALSGKEVDFPKESLPLYEAMARRGNWMAMRWTTFCYGLGIGMDIDYDKAVYFYLSLTTLRTEDLVSRTDVVDSTYVPVSVLTGDGCIRIPYKLSELSEYDFYKCKGKFRVDAKNVLSIGKRCFESSGITDIILSDELESIGEEAFMESDLESIVIPSKVKKIETRAFYGCRKLNDVTIRDGVEEIGDQAFGEAPLLRTLVVPPSVKKIGKQAIFCKKRKGGFRAYVYGKPDMEQGAFADGTKLLPCYKPMDPEDYGKDANLQEGDKGVRRLFGKKRSLPKNGKNN